MLKDVGDNEGKVNGTGPGTQEVQLVGFRPYRYYIIIILIPIITVRETLSLCSQGFADSSPQHALRKTHIYKRKKKIAKDLSCRAGIANSDYRAKFPGATEPWRGKKVSCGGTVRAGKKTHQYNDKRRNFFCCLER